MRKFAWVKAGAIQIVFISIAVVVTVLIGHISISEQFTTYYENKLEAKAETLARNAALLFTEGDVIQDASGMRVILDIIFPGYDGGTEIIQYAIFEVGGHVSASNIVGNLTLPDSAGIYTYMALPIVRSYHPVKFDGVLRYVIMVQIDSTPFLEYGQELSDTLRISLIRGCLMMVIGYAIFTFIINSRKSRNPSGGEEIPKVGDKGSFGRVAVYLVIMGVFAVIALPFLWFGMLWVGGLLAAVAAVHLVRVLLWFFSWYFRRPISGYAAQTIQFSFFLMVFLSIYSYSIYTGYRVQTEVSTQNQLRISSVFAGLSLSGAETIDLSSAEVLDFGEQTQTLVISRTEHGFSAACGTDIYNAEDLFSYAWDGQASVAGKRGGYKYGVTIVVNNYFELIALAAVRQSSDIQAQALRGTTIDFLLAMSATVLVFVFLFIELNRMLEVVNTPNMNAEHGKRYAKSVRSLMFLVSACRHIPLFFFVLIVYDIYGGGFATMLPISVVLLVMALGGRTINRIIRINSRKMMLLGCVIGAAGFLSLPFAASLPIFLLLLVLTYTGVSMVYNGLWNFASDNEETANTLSGEYLGGMAGAVMGAMVFDRFGLFTAFALAAAVLLVLAVLVRALLPMGSVELQMSKNGYGFFKFFFCRRVLFYIFLLFMPFVLGEYFIEQFSPLYAESIALSPGAASWTALLMTLALAYAGPPIVRLLSGRFGNTMICVFANILAAIGLLLFAVFPGIIAMYAASALIGVSIGVGKNIIFSHYSELKETELYAHSGYVHSLFGSLFGLLGAALFTMAHVMSPAGEYVLIIAGVVAVATVLYLILGGRAKA